MKILKDNVNYCKQLISTVDEVRHFDEIKGNFLINETTYAGISIAQEKTLPLPQLIISDVQSFVEQQQFYFNLLWNNSIPVHLDMKVKWQNGGEAVGREGGERGEREEILSMPPPPPPPPLLKLEKKTEVLYNKQEILKKLEEFYQNSNEIRYCSPVDAIKLIYSNYLDLHHEILKKYKDGKHKGIKWLTSLNNKEDIGLVKKFMDDGIEIRHVKDLLISNFALSDKTFLFTVEKIEDKKMVTNAIYSNETLYINHYNTIFESLWKKSIDIHDRIMAIEEDHSIDVDVIPNPKESLKFIKELFKNVKSEVLLILSSSVAIFRVEGNFGLKFFEDLALNGIKVRILIPLEKDLQVDMNSIKAKYKKIEFRNFYTDLKSILGVIIIDGEKVLLLEVKDETKRPFVDSIGATIFIEGKSTAMSYFSIFDSLWKQAELYDELKKAYEKIQNHDKMQKEFINTAAHELRTPLQPIIGIATILNREIQGERHKELIDVLSRNVQRLKTLSKDILDVTRIESDTLLLDKEYFAIKELILEVIDNYKNEVTTKNINSNIILLTITIMQLFMQTGTE